MVCALLLATRVSAQVANPSLIQFSSADQTTTIPAGQVNAGQPTLTSYQALLLAAASDATTGPIVQTGGVIPKTAVVASGVTNSPYQLPFSALGLTIPTCTTATCPQYTVVLLAIGPGGISLRGVGAESNPFTAAVPVATAPPAAPGNVIVK
jgi:hypothetical protein